MFTFYAPRAERAREPPPLNTERALFHPRESPEQVLEEQVQSSSLSLSCELAWERDSTLDLSHLSRAAIALRGKLSVIWVHFENPRALIAPRARVNIPITN